jgi:hypothetical protein
MLACLQRWGSLNEETCEQVTNDVHIDCPGSQRPAGRPNAVTDSRRTVSRHRFTWSGRKVDCLDFKSITQLDYLRFVNTNWTVFAGLLRYFPFIVNLDLAEIKHFRLMRATATTLSGVSQVPVTVIEAFTSILSGLRVVAS